MSYFFYIAHCADNTLYSGHCRNIKKREITHNKGTGAKYTRCRLPIKIIYFETFTTRSDAAKREYEVKKFTRIEKINLINSKDT